MTDMQPGARVWDLPVRLFHWMLAVLILVLFVTGNLGGDWLEWHKRAGYAVLALVLFRVIWGAVGNYHARFVNFVRGPRSVAAYVKTLAAGTSQPSFGHNPLGALSVIALLAVVALQAVTGLFANDDIMLEGPFASRVSKQLSDLLTRVHKLNSDLLLFLIALHVLAIAYYYFARKENLLTPMFTGIKNIVAESAEKLRPAWLAWVIAAVAGMAVYLLVKN